jgi:hypothetical protein
MPLDIYTAQTTCVDRELDDFVSYPDAALRNYYTSDQRKKRLISKREFPKWFVL